MKKNLLPWILCAFLLFTNLISIFYIGRNGWFSDTAIDLTDKTAPEKGLLLLEETVPSKKEPEGIPEKQIVADTTGLPSWTEGYGETSIPPSAIETTAPAAAETTGLPPETSVPGGNGLNDLPPLLAIETTASSAPDEYVDRSIPPFAESGLSVIELKDPVTAGSKASIKIRGTPGATYSIKVTYKSGVSSAKGLEDKIADESGVVVWSWTVGAKTAEGTYPIEVNGPDGELKTTFTVKKKSE